MSKLKLLVISVSLFIASQQAVALNLNIYGVGHVSADSVDDGQDSSIYVTSNSSRLGFSGDHELDGGLKAIFQYETGLDVTSQGVNDGNGGATSTGQIFTKGRPTFVGLSGDFGKVLIGHMPALDQWVNDYNLFADQVGDLGNLWEASGVPGRFDNVTQYATPDVGGLKVAVTYKPEEGVDDTDDIILKGDYASNKLKVGAAYASIGQGVGSDEHTALAFTGSYTGSAFSIGGGFQQESDIGGVSGDDRDSFSFGASTRLNDKDTIKVQFAISEGEGNDTDATQIAIGYDHALDKHTTVYVTYATMNNDANVAFSVNGKGHGDKVVPANGDDPAALSFGIVYKFDAQLVKQ
jgi:predicted porin